MYEPDRFLAKFRSEAGLTPKAEHYHGWEDDTIAGHSHGHYLSACSLMYRTTGDDRFLTRVNYIVDELAECQDADAEGYIGAIPDGKRILAQEVARGDIRAQRFDLNGLWAPFYTQHKVVKGLLDAHQLCGNQKAFEVARKFADWLGSIFLSLNENQIQEMLECEHGGINEVLAGDLGPEKDPRVKDPMYVPVLMTEERDPAKWLVPVEAKPNTFRMDHVGRPRDVELKPFYQTHERRYTVYWDMFTEAEWLTRQKECETELERKKESERMSVDFVQPGEESPKKNTTSRETGPGRGNSGKG